MMTIIAQVLLSGKLVTACAISLLHYDCQRVIYRYTSNTVLPSNSYECMFEKKRNSKVAAAAYNLHSLQLLLSLL